MALLGRVFSGFNLLRALRTDGKVHRYLPAIEILFKVKISDSNIVSAQIRLRPHLVHVDSTRIRCGPDLGCFLLSQPNVQRNPLLA